MYIADLHIHSRFSRATSKEGDAPHLEFWARRKGIQLIGTGDFTHPAWRAELKEQLVPAEEGLYTLRDDLRLPCDVGAETPRFVVTGEISSIYKRGGKTRKVHNVIILPSLEAADELSAKLEAIGNIHSDGRPILGLDSRDLLEITLETCPNAEFIPAHIWTPHFAMFGAFSGFDSIKECFDDLTPYIHAVETGLSSDPPMNWRVSQLDGLTLVSHSDAHSPAKLGREADILDTGLSYTEMVEAIRTGNGFSGTIEFFPEEGKYHLDGHRNCGVCLTPVEAAGLDNICPVCGKKLTIGVEHRVEELADRPAGHRPDGAKPYESLVPLPEVIAASTGTSATSKKTLQRYENILSELGPEFYILRTAPIEDIEKTAGPCVAEGIRRLRQGKVSRRAGFDGEYGVISLLTPSEIEQLNGQMSLFGVQSMQIKEKAKREYKKSVKSVSSEQAAELAADVYKDASKSGLAALNMEQQRAATASERVVAVIAGPGTGKTKTLISRIEYLISNLGVRPDEITAVTFTNQAAAEMRERLEKQLGGKRAASKITIGTFHSICLNMLSGAHLISEGEALDIADELLRSSGRKLSAKSFINAVSKVKNGVNIEDSGIDAELYDAYGARLKELGVLDFDDLLTEALKIDITGRRSFKYLLIDEFQDINDMQFELINLWSKCCDSLFVIGDPDQSIYGFRGSTGRCFERLHESFPDMCEIRLKENYRSTPEILQAAAAVIEKNPGEKRLLNPNLPAGEAVRVVRTADELGEGIYIAKEIGRMAGGVDMLEAQSMHHEREAASFSDIAVLCRTHRQLELIEKCLRHDDIPCVISGREDYLSSDDVRGVLSFFHSLEDISDLASLAASLRLLWGCPSDLIEKAQKVCAGLKTFDAEVIREAFYNSVSGSNNSAAGNERDNTECNPNPHTTALNIGESIGDAPQKRAYSALIYGGIGMPDTLRQAERLRENRLDTTERFSTASQEYQQDGDKSDSVQSAAEVQGKNEQSVIDFPLDKWLERAEAWMPLVKKEKPHKLIEKWEQEFGATPSLDKLKNAAVFFSSFKNMWNALILGEEADICRTSGKHTKSGAVRLMTLHGAKGLEFDTVFIAGANTGKLPLESQGKAADVEEERRLMYVGLTRAKEKLIITTASPSVFLADLPQGVLWESAVPRKRVVEQLSLF